MIYAAPCSVLFVLLRLVCVHHFEHGVPPGGHGQFSFCLNLFVSLGGCWHSLSVPLRTVSLLLIVREFSEFRVYLIQYGVVLALFVDVHVRVPVVDVLCVYRWCHVPL